MFHFSHPATTIKFFLFTSQMMLYFTTTLKQYSLLAAICLLTACKSAPPAPPPATPVAAPAYTGPSLSIEQSDRGVQVFLPSNILFDSGKSELRLGDAAPYLDRVAQLLKTKTQNKISVEGHTDSAGSLTANQKLSEQRAVALMQSLQERGVPADRMVTAGFAFNRPIASNANEEGRKLNRRVEVVILDEKVANITKGEPPNAFNSAWDNLKKMIEAGVVKPAEAAK
ncbi:MAG: OmpA family protein [Burkholderiales bacterium]|nr:MAG: OmpA family protein [Burkholderiales bacterium]